MFYQMKPKRCDDFQIVRINAIVPFLLRMWKCPYCTNVACKYRLYYTHENEVQSGAGWFDRRACINCYPRISKYLYKYTPIRIYHFLFCVCLD